MGPPLRDRHLRRYLPALAGLGPQHLLSRHLVLHRLCGALPGGRRRPVLEAQHPVRRLRLRAHRGRAVVLFLLSGMESARLYRRHDRGNARSGDPSRFCRGHDRRLAVDQATGQNHHR